MVPFLLLLEVHIPLLGSYSYIRKIDAQPAMFDNGAEIVNLSAPQQWHTTLDLTASPMTFRNGGSPLATIKVVVAELLGQERYEITLRYRGKQGFGGSFASGTEVLR